MTKKDIKICKRCQKLADYTGEYRNLAAAQIFVNYKRLCEQGKTKEADYLLDFAEKYAKLLKKIL